jgi:hypothetical protein
VRRNQPSGRAARDAYDFRPDRSISVDDVAISHDCDRQPFASEIPELGVAAESVTDVAPHDVVVQRVFCEPEAASLLGAFIAWAARTRLDTSRVGRPRGARSLHINVVERSKSSETRGQHEATGGRCP